MRTALMFLALISASGMSDARADTLDLRKVGCGDFAETDGTSKTNIAIWLNGYYMGENDEAIIDWDKVNNLGNALIKYCAANPKKTLSNAAETLMGKGK
jgi:acid stress chaperone HdeB